MIGLPKIRFTNSIKMKKILNQLLPNISSIFTMSTILKRKYTFLVNIHFPLLVRA